MARGEASENIRVRFCGQLFPIAALAFALSTLCGCDLPQPQESSPPEFDVHPQIVAPEKDAAVLLVEDHMMFLAESKTSGGQRAYLHAVNGLAKILNKHGVRTYVEAVEDSSVTLRQLATYRAIYVIDSNAMYQNLTVVLEQYLRCGGVLIGIGEFARFNGGWQKEWPFGKLFGLHSRACDPWGTGVTWDDSGIYWTAKRKSDDRLLDGLGHNINWGTNATLAWATAPAGAKVVAVFPQHVMHSSENAKPRIMDVPIPAVTVRQLERGIAVFCAPIPTGHRPGGWDATSDAGRLLANALKYAPEHLVLPPDIPEVTVGRNQAAYEPDWPKTIVVRVETQEPAPRIHGAFAVRGEGDSVLKRGKLVRWPDRFWKSQYLTLDLTEVTAPGSYRVEIDLPQTGNRILSRFRVADNMLLDEIMPLQIEFLRGMRCGEKCHVKDPVVGGHHDASGDWGVRMWSMPHLVWALARYLEVHPSDMAAKDELMWAIDWCLHMQAPDGAAWHSIKPPNDRSPIETRPWQDKSVRELDKTYSYGYTATYAAGLARAAAALRPHHPTHATKALEASTRAFARLERNDATITSDLGNRLWAAIEIYRAGGGQGYLKKAREDVPTILERQLPAGHVKDANVYGDYFADASKTGFSPQQYKVFHSIGIYLGQIELARALPTDSLLRADIRTSLKTFTEGYLLGMSSLTPYRQMANALEPHEDGKFRVFHFSHRKSWVRDHGLNCDMLAMGTVALELAKDTGDDRLRALAADQINWLLGCNPFGHSMMTGIGQKEAPLIPHKLGTGHIKGGIPNGIMGIGKFNLPAWGTSWDSREYWLPHNAYLISSIALLTTDGTETGK